MSRYKSLSHAEQHVFRVFHKFFPFIGESGDSGTIQNSMVTTEADVQLMRNLIFLLIN